MVTHWLLSCLPQLGQRVLIDPAHDFDGDGYAETDGDCNDRDPSVHPGAVTIPGDALDQDCVGGDTLPEPDNDTDTDTATDTDAGPTDEDGDGADSVEDCDDTNPDRYPWNVEVCDDGTDQNCDDLDPACKVVGLVAPDLWWSDGAINNWPLWAPGDVNGDFLNDILVGDVVAERITVLTFDGSGPGALEATAEIIGSVSLDGLGSVAAGVGDTDGDGTADIVVGLPNDGLDRGTVILLQGPLVGDIDVIPSAPSGSVEISGGVGDGIGGALAGADIDADGWIDVVVSGTVGGSGEVFVVYGPRTDVADIGEDVGVASFVSDEFPGLENIGHSVAVGDLSGDGIPEVAATSQGDVDDPQRIFVIAGQGARYAAETDITTFQTFSAGMGGVAWAAPNVFIHGDLTGDGTDDLVVGWPNGDAGLSAGGPGVTTVYSGLSGPGYDAWDDATTRIIGGVGGDDLGSAVSTADLDGDGVFELATSAPGYDEGYNDIGAVFFFYDVQGRTEDLYFDAGDSHVIGDVDSGRLGTGMTGIDDVNGDGWDDVAMGTIGNNGVALLYGGALD